jgi:toxin HigB-1
VKIRNFTRKGVKKIYAEDSAKGVPPDSADKLRKMLAFLDDMQDRRNCARSRLGKRTY